MIKKESELKRNGNRTEATLSDSDSSANINEMTISTNEIPSSMLNASTDNTSLHSSNLESMSSMDTVDEREMKEVVAIIKKEINNKTNKGKVEFNDNPIVTSICSASLTSSSSSASSIKSDCTVSDKKETTEG